MRGRMLVALAGLLACIAIGAAGSAGAATLDFTGTLTFSGWFSTSPPSVQGSGSGAALVNGSVGGTHLNSFVIGAGAVGPITTSLSLTVWMSINSVVFTGLENLTGSFGGLSGGPPGGGPMGLSGLMKLCMLFAPCEYANVTVPMTPVGGVGFGIGGTQFIPNAAISLTMQHTPWTIGQPVVTIHTPNTNVTTPVLPGGFAHGPASLTSSTAQPSGVVQLVSVSKVFTSLTWAYPEYPAIGILTLHFVPEPGTLLLLGSGVAALALRGRRKRGR